MLPAMKDFPPQRAYEKSEDKIFNIISYQGPNSRREETLSLLE